MNEYLTNHDIAKIYLEGLPNKRYKKPIDFSTRLYNYINTNQLQSDYDYFYNKIETKKQEDKKFRETTFQKYMVFSKRGRLCEVKRQWRKPK